MAAQANRVWWEKTVEYKFVRECLPPAAAVAPLAGKAEAAYGDAVLRQGETYLLIEFKRALKHAPSELEKFERAHRPSSATASLRPVARLRAALEQLKEMEQSAAHHLVFGKMEADNFLIAAIKYTDAWEQSPIQTVLNGTSTEQLARRPRKEMLAYLAKLRELRGPDTVSGGSVIVGVCEGTSTVFSVDEFVTLEHRLQLSLEQSLSRSTSSKGRSGPGR